MGVSRFFLYRLVRRGSVYRIYGKKIREPRLSLRNCLPDLRHYCDPYDRRLVIRLAGYVQSLSPFRRGGRRVGACLRICA